MKKSFGIILVVVMSIIFMACGKTTESITGTTPTPVSKSTSETAEAVTSKPANPVTSEPTQTHVEDRYVKLTEEEFKELFDKAHVYGVYSLFTGLIVEYYKYINLEEIEVPVIVCYQVEEAEEIFGGEWEYIPGTILEVVDQGIDYEDQHWARGILTIAEIEHEMLYGDKRKIYITNDDSVDSSYIGIVEPEEITSYADYMRWLRHVGQFRLMKDQDGVPLGIDGIYLNN